MNYWFMRMRQGAGGEDFTETLWKQGLVGVLFGTWGIEHVVSDDGHIDPSKLNADAIQKECPQPPGITLDDAFMRGPQRFLLEARPADRVVISFDGKLCIGELAAGYRNDPNPPRGPYQEQFKCRPVVRQKVFPIEELPSSYRLIAATGRSAIQRIKAYQPLVELLNECNTTTEVRDALLAMHTGKFMELLSPKQWEVLCGEYLREREGFRPLLLAVGGTLAEVDLYGVDGKGKRVLAQCKNNTAPYDPDLVVEWEKNISKTDTDRLFFFPRGGLKESHRRNAAALEPIVITGREVEDWLNSDSKYQRHLKSL
jgi:hypothetical protein